MAQHTSPADDPAGAHLTDEERRERDRREATGTGLHTGDTTLGADLSGEDLSRGPTPATRHPAAHVGGVDEDGSGGYDDLNDTTQGPTPETRQVMRATDLDGAASGQPQSDPDTRADVGGNQDLEPTRAVDPRRDH